MSSPSSRPSPSLSSLPNRCDDPGTAPVHESLAVEGKNRFVRSKIVRQTWGSSLIARLPDDVVMGCLARLTRTSWMQLRLVSKAWKRAVEDPFFYQCRVGLGVTEEWCYTKTWNSTTKAVSWFALDAAEEKWLALPPIPRRRGVDPDIFGQGSGSLNGELYVFGGQAGVDGPTLRDVYIYSPFTLRWRKGTSLINTRHSPIVFLVYGVIYVMGGFDSFGKIVPCGERFDAEREQWVSVGNEEHPEVFCPTRYQRGWQEPWSPFLWLDHELYVTYHAKNSEQGIRQLIKYYSAKKGRWVFSGHKDKTKALVTYSLGATVDRHVILVDWATGRLRYTYYPCRSVGWVKVQGLAELDWVEILTNNPKVIGVGTKMLLVGRGLNVLMIETHPVLVVGDDSLTIIAGEQGAEGLEALNCVMVDA